MKNILLFPLLTCGLLFTGCGKKDAASPVASPAAGSAAATAPAAAGPAVIEITANDSMKFNLTRFEVNAGQEVKIIFTNLGTMPKVAMGHNLIVLKKDTDLKAYTDAAVMAAATDYVPAAKTDQVIAHTKLLGPKQTDEITFKAPADAGDYPFLCSFPAHYLSGMKGVMVVK